VIETLYLDNRTFITQTPTNTFVRISGINAGGLEKSHLAQMGLVIGTPVRVLRNRENEPILITLRNSKLILGRKLASKIQVSDNQ